MSIKIIKQGVQTTLQDTGRPGFRTIGIGTGGAADIFAMKTANFLAGNDDDMAVMEINFPAPEILFQQQAIISLTGAHLTATINHTTIPLWKPFLIKKDELLHFKQPLWGARAYLAVQGGWRSEKWLNSYSTHLKVVAGGHLGRALQKDDVIVFNDFNFSLIENKALPWHISHKELDKIYQPQHTIRCVKSIEWELLTQAAQFEIEKSLFNISRHSDRMGYRLNGTPLNLLAQTSIISSAVDAGTIQLLPDGQLIVLMADYQTTGGYPRIGSVIKADIPKLAQLNAGQSFNFKIVSIKEAEEALMEMKKMLADIKTSCHLNFEKYFQL